MISRRQSTYFQLYDGATEICMRYSLNFTCQMLLTLKIIELKFIVVNDKEQKNILRRGILKDLNSLMIGLKVGKCTNYHLKYNFSITFL